MSRHDALPVSVPENLGKNGANEVSNVNPDLTVSGGPGKSGANTVSNVNPDLTVSGGPGKSGANTVSNVNPDLTVSGELREKLCRLRRQSFSRQPDLLPYFAYLVDCVYIRVSRNFIKHNVSLKHQKKIRYMKPDSLTELSD